MKDAGMLLITAGAVLLLVGLIFVLAGKLSWPGHLPGDIHISGKHGSFSFPLTTCILVSVVLTVLLNVFLRLFHR
jgi:hypothetical protein